MTRTLLVLLTGLAVLGAALPAAAQTSVDPQSLVGDWTGTWSGRVSMRGSENSGEYVLRITKVVRDQEGLPQDRLTFGTSPQVTELTINGDHMSGTATTPESHQLKIELTKAK